MAKLKTWFPIALGLLCVYVLAGCADASCADTTAIPQVTVISSTDIDCAQYPHWQCDDPALQRIDQFIKAYQGRNYVVATDWDGTLYSETIAVKGAIHTGATRSGQSVWHLWGAQHGYFPAFETEDGDWVENVVRQDDYLEGKTSAELGEYSKFAQIATFEAGMTPQEMHEGLQRYLDDYPSEDYAYLKMLDVMQQFKNNGFQVWIITGSNPYFIASLLHDVDQALGYDLLAEGCDPKDPDLKQCQIVGNGAEQSPDGRFTLVYDDRFVRLSEADDAFFLERIIIDGAGKEVALRRYIEVEAQSFIVFYAGNSGGDYEAIEYVLEQDNVDSLAVAVNPRGTLQDLVAVYEPQGKLIQVAANCAKP